MERWEGLLNKTARSISADLPGQGTVQRAAQKKNSKVLMSVTYTAMKQGSTTNQNVSL